MEVFVGLVCLFFMNAFALYLASFFTGMKNVTLSCSALIAGASALATCFFGSLVGFILMSYLLTAWTEAEFWPDVILVVVVAFGIKFVGSSMVVGAVV